MNQAFKSKAEHTFEAEDDFEFDWLAGLSAALIAAPSTGVRGMGCDAISSIALNIADSLPSTIQYRPACASVCATKEMLMENDMHE